MQLTLFCSSAFFLRASLAARISWLRIMAATAFWRSFSLASLASLRASSSSGAGVGVCDWVRTLPAPTPPSRSLTGGLETGGTFSCLPLASGDSLLCQKTLMKRLFSTASVERYAAWASACDENVTSAPSGSPLKFTCKLTIFPNLLKWLFRTDMLLRPRGIFFTSRQQFVGS